MCGILGLFGNSLCGEDEFGRMLNTLRHRGPDDAGIARTATGLLGHQRLSILDVEGGHQPLSASSRQEVMVVCNGEIYNNEQLRSEFAADYTFTTRSDSENILPLFLAEGADAARRLDGMFAFVLSNGSDYYAGRDSVGIKPLYYGTQGDNIWFASEIKALVDQAERIHEFPNGHVLSSGGRLRPFYEIREREIKIRDEATATRRIRQTLASSVRKRLMADVPVGVFLSGGLDSSLIAALMKQDLEELHSFSVGLAGSPDLAAARKVAEHIGTIHHEYIYTEEEMLAVLDEVIYYLESYDPALVRSSIPCYFVSRLAGKHVKVVLSGEGADELFAGYSYFSKYKDPDAMMKESLRILNGLHNVNLQRVDRMTMAHSIEGRVPFLDLEFIETVLEIDPALKMPDYYRLEKGLLRKAFEDLLPTEIVWRDKMEFAQGCGSSQVLEKDADVMISDGELARAREEGQPVRCKEELFYFNIFKKHFDHPDAAALVGSWQGELH